MFSFESSRFTIDRSKESTARVALWREYRIPNIFTLEASFFGYDTPDGRTEAFTENDFMNIGKSFCRALYVYITHVKGVSAIVEISDGPENAEDEKTDETECKPKQKLSLNTTNLLAELKNNKKLLTYGDASDESGSDSNPSDDDLPKEHLVKVLPKAIYAKISKKNDDDKSKNQSPIPVTPKKTSDVASTASETKRPSKLSPSPIKHWGSKRKHDRKALKGSNQESQTEERIFELLEMITCGSEVSKEELDSLQLIIVTPSKNLRICVC